MSLGAYQSEVGRGNLLNALAHPAVVNPAGAMASAAQTANALYSLRQNQADQAVGGILQQATDPQGNVDYGKANALAAQAGPVVQMGMQNMLANNAARRGQQIAQAGAMNTAVGGAITAALQAPNEQLESSVVQQAQRLIDLGLPRDGILTSLLRMPSDPAQLRQQLETYRTSLLPPDQATQQIYGAPGTATGPGGVQVGTMQNPRTGTLTAPPGQGVQLGLGPEGQAGMQKWLAEPVDVPDLNKQLPNGQPNPNYMRTTPMPRGDYLRAQGVNPATLFPGGQGGSSPGTSPLGTGRLPPALMNPNRPQTAPAGAPVPTQSSSPPPVAQAPVGAQPSPGEADLAKTSPARFQAESDADTKAQNQQAILGNMLSDTTQFTSGPLAGIVGKVRNMAGNLGLNVNTDAQSAKESFNKLAAGLADAQGAGSDARMNVNISANPHEELSPAGVDLILRQLQGNSDYMRARASLARQWPSKSDYGGFQDRIKDLDPRVFQLTRMTGPQRTTYWNSLDDQTQKQVGAAIKKAKDMGVLGGG